MEFILWLLASPFLVLRAAFRALRRARYYRLSYAAAIRCRSCRAPISLVGHWRCGCGYTYRGHLLRECPVCGSLPRMVRCFRCGLTEVLPEP
jgi:hypothetical protein